jgi:RNA polymerase sigma-70 factor (ECF subfamily)
MVTAGTGSGGHDDGFETLFRRYYARIWRYFRWGGVSDDESHDLTQETFKRFYERRSQLRGDDPWPFLQSIAKSILLNRIRERKALKRTGVTVSFDDPDSGIDLPDNEWIDPGDREQEALQQKAFRAALKELSIAQQECVLLRIDGLQYNEIAAALNITENAVKSRLRDATKALKARLGEKK